jgi:hypothetical protein
MKSGIWEPSGYDSFIPPYAVDGLLEPNFDSTTLKRLVGIALCNVLEYSSYPMSFMSSKIFRMSSLGTETFESPN